MSTRLSFLNEVYFKHYPIEGEISFIKIDTVSKHFYRLFSVHTTYIYDLLSQKISFSQFSQNVHGIAYDEFHQVLVIFRDLKLIMLDGKSHETELKLDDEGVLFKGQHIVLKYEMIHFEESIYAPGSPSVSEGATCSPQGDVQCGYDGTFYECISDGTWAGLGTSC